MPEYTPYQRKVIDRYYDHRDTIMLGKLQEIVTDLYLATEDKKRDQLWKRADKAMTSLKVPPKIAAPIVAKREVEALARNVRDWLSQASGKR